VENSKILALDYHKLHGLTKQRRFVLEMMTSKMPCPNCGTKQSPLEAHGIALDDFDTGAMIADKTQCINCNREIKYTVPIFYQGNPWTWTLIPIAK
jgi:predicted RNA-binding Zn-ribbon protein involved in translation (DUF1610 family)